MQAFLAVPRFAGYARGALVLVVSDGLERGDHRAMTDAVARLSALAWRVSWLTPLAVDPRYRPETDALKSILPLIDDLADGSSTERLCAHVLQLSKVRTAWHPPWRHADIRMRGEGNEHAARDQDPRLRRHRARVRASSSWGAIAAARAASSRSGFLILGGPWPIVVDTGYRSNQIMETLGMRGLQFHENMIENQLARHGVRMGDVRFVMHTHLHIDHAGKDDLFPLNTTVVVNRRELEYSVSGLMHPQYPAPDIKHLIDRLHTKNALRFLDLELSGPIEICPGVYCEAANAHTEGSMNVHVHTAEGIATICGDVIYDFNDQIVEPFRITQAFEPQVTGNHGTSKRQEKAAITQAAQQCALPAAGARPAGEDRRRPGGRPAAGLGAGADHPVAAAAKLVPGLTAVLEGQAR